MLKSENKNLPLISIVIPSLNKVAYIDKTLDSIFNQNYPNLEVIIQDGGSTDGSLNVIKKYAKKYPNFIHWKSGRDKGQLSAILSGIRKARGEILAYINADDVYENGAFKRVADEYLKASDRLWFVGYGDMINSRGQKTSNLVVTYKKILTRLNSYRLLLMVNYIMQPSVFLTRKAYNKFGPFAGTAGFILEYDMWLKLGRVEMPGLVPFNLSSFRMSGVNISSRQYASVLEADTKIVKKHTRNNITLGLHYIHNYFRTLLVKTL